MSRAKRTQSPHLLRHVMSRGNGKMAVFLDDHDYRRFVGLLGDIAEDFGIECWNYCVMPNHYHLTVLPTLSNFSEAIRRLNAAYAQAWNRRHGKVGHVFQGRFKDQIVDRDTYLLTLSRYVVMNPVRAGLVSRPGDWPWSSYRATAGLEETPAFLLALPTLKLFGEAPETVLQARFAEWVEAPLNDSPLVDRIRSRDRVLGSRAFKLTLKTSDPGLTPV